MNKKVLAMVGVNNNNDESPVKNAQLVDAAVAPVVETLQGKRIDVTRDDQLRYWSTYFGVTPEQLCQAVRTVGPWARAVSAHLK